ncbi:MAG: dTMP kinase [Candidatus Micrarchaeota archaeon]|nr:dTMP kinase [Candidatus Micrarchaeota archaeon]
MGKFIVLEGLEGCGKTTQAKLLYEALRERGEKCVLTKEPTQSDIGKLIMADVQKKEDRLDIMGLQFLFVADRMEHVAKFIVPKLDEGYTIVSDRYSYSTITHVHAFAKPPYSDLDWMLNVHSKLPVPDAVIYINVSPELAMERINSRGDGKRRFDNPANLKALAKSYSEIGKKLPKIWHIVDGNKSQNEVTEQLLAVFDSL